MNQQFKPVVKQLLIANILIFILSQFVKESYTYLAQYYIENPNFRFWQPITHMFMHSPNFMHILFNMIALVSFGNLLEHFWGAKKFLIFYLLCGIGASILHQSVDFVKFNYLSSTLQSPEIFFGISVGASGAIYGLLVAYAFMFPNSELMLFFIPVPIKVKFLVPILVGLDLFSGITGQAIFSPPNTGFFAHVGGAVTGLILMLLWKNKKFNHNRWN